MQYVVLCNTTRRNLSNNGRDYTEHRSTHTMLTCVSKADANRICEALANADWQEQRDGLISYVQRTYEVAVQLYAGTVKRQKITLSESDLEMIASQYTAPQQEAAE